MSRTQKKKTVRKKTGTRKRASRRGARRRGLVSRLWRPALLLFGLLLGVAAVWVAWLDQRVTREFEGRRWDVPSRVYARPLTLYPGMRLDPGDLAAELDAAGYQFRPGAELPGQYERNGARWTIHRRAFRFEDGSQPALRFQVVLGGGRVERIEGAGGSSLVRLDPALWASIWPQHSEDRTLVRIEDVPALLVTGLQAVEDRRFKQHHGVDLRAIGRAALANLRAGRTVEGGSTLTQQLVKNYFLDSRQTLWRKANEAVMAVLLERQYGKAEILEAYLNEVYLGQQGARAIHGFGRAAEFYFDQPVDRLPPEQVALLVGLARGASLYNPWRNPERALERRNFVLGQFADTGLLPDDQVAQLKRRPLGVVDAPRAAGSMHPAFLELVRRQLQRDYEDADLQTTGLSVFTTLAPTEQHAAERALQQGLERLAERGLPAELQGAIVLADTTSGEVRAVVGDRYPGRSGFNRALDARRQVGSVIKPLVYLLALEHPQEYTLLTRIEDAPISLRQPNGSQWTPRNHDDVVHGGVNLLDALVHSYNLATVRLGLEVGVNNLVTQLRRLGVEADVPPVPATLLGAVELTPLEVAQVYQSLAAGGFSAPLRAVTAVLDPEGRPLNRYPLRMRPLDRRDAIGVLNFALSRVVEDGTARALPGLLGRYEPVAGKTGTTNDRRDSWFVGYTADRVGVAWVGLDDHAPAGVTGSNAAMPVWAGLFRELPWEPLDLRLPEGATYAWVDPQQRLLSHPDCPGAQEWAFVEGSQPREKTECAYDMDEDENEPFWKRWLED